MNLTITSNFATQTQYRMKAQNNKPLNASPAVISFGQKLSKSQSDMVNQIIEKARNLYPKIIKSGNLQVSMDEISEGAQRNHFTLQALNPTPEGYKVEAAFGPDYNRLNIRMRDKDLKGWESRINYDDVVSNTALDGIGGTHIPGMVIPENLLTSALKTLLS